jgi:hypothetical protein
VPQVKAADKCYMKLLHDFVSTLMFEVNADLKLLSVALNSTFPPIRSRPCLAAAGGLT